MTTVFSTNRACALTTNDLYLLGAPLIGHYQGYKSGHDLNNKLCLALEKSPQSWCWTELDRDSSIEIDYGENYPLPQAG